MTSCVFDGGVGFVVLVGGLGGWMNGIGRIWRDTIGESQGWVVGDGGWLSTKADDFRNE